jgi:phosphoenolpyruvate-protein kinase (PTS system EI component)
MAFDPSSFLGPIGGLIAIAYGAGTASGYAFCLRTMYQIVKAQSDKNEKNCEHELEELKQKLEQKEAEIRTLNERLIYGLERQKLATHNAGVYLIEKKEDN